MTGGNTTTGRTWCRYFFFIRIMEWIHSKLNRKVYFLYLYPLYTVFFIEKEKSMEAGNDIRLSTRRNNKASESENVWNLLSYGDSGPTTHMSIKKLFPWKWKWFVFLRVPFWFIVTSGFILTSYSFYVCFTPAEDLGLSKSNELSILGNPYAKFTWRMHCHVSFA